MTTNEQLQANIRICPKHQINKKTIGNAPYCIWICEICDKEAEDHEIKEQERRQIEAAEKEKLKLAEKRNDGIPFRFHDSAITDFQNIETIKYWLNKPSDFLYIMGQCGTGKTHLAAACAYYLRDRKEECLFTVSSIMFMILRSAITDKSHFEHEIIRRYATAPIAIFDDIGAQKISEYVIESWYNIIDQRYGAKLPTIFTSNMTLEELSVSMTDRIASRIASGIIFELIGNDRRINK